MSTTLEQNSAFQNKQLWLVAGIWLIICLVQAYLTELHPDEALYWVYTKEMSWGYFEQPPMVALFIKVGYSIFNNELGVRLLVVLTHFVNLGIIYKLAKAQKPLVFALVLGSLFLIHAGSLLAVPDAPLVFFSCLFLLQLSKVKDRILPSQAISLSLISACMLYSKYHALVFLGILFLLQLKHRKEWLYYLIPVGALVLYFPHILWQIDHDWVSFRFHLFNRDLVDYQAIWILYFIMGQILLLLPLIILSKMGAWQRYSLTSFQKTLLYFSGSFFTFFLYGKRPVFVVSIFKVEVYVLSKISSN
jgi:4-amino-4-deoxy-L-arabinose transferase-like glycosyltransferase